MSMRVTDIDQGFNALKLALLKDAVFLVGIDDARVAAYAGKHELGIGTKKRSFLVSTMQTDQSSLLKKLEAACDAGLFGGMSREIKAVAEGFRLRVRGRILGGEIRPSTNDGQPTLVETGALVGSLIVKEAR